MEVINAKLFGRGKALQTNGFIMKYVSISGFLYKFLTILTLTTYL